MSKRMRGGADDTQRPPKRPKPDASNHASLPPIQEIHFARQIQETLVFRQDDLAPLRAGIASFKAFLESILYHRDNDIRPRQLSILREYLDSERPAGVGDGTGAEESGERPFLAQLWQAWSFADTGNNDALASGVSALLALLVKTLSGLLDLRDFGVLLCRTLLQGRHLRLVKRGLEASRHKEFVISPCLRLLTEAVGFDGGVLVREFYKRREMCFEVGMLRRGLGMVKVDISEEEMRRKPSVRTLTVRYIMTYLKYLPEGGKADVLKVRPLCTALFHHLSDDTEDLVNELLSTTEQYVLKDNEVPRSAKAALLVERNLEKVTEVATRSENDHAAAPKAFSWLTAVCTIPSYGIVRPNGWYPPGTARLEQQGSWDDSIDLGLDSIDFYDSSSRPSVRNTTLLSWIQTLRPHANVQERELILTCFKSAPELVAAYFAEKNMQLDPKLTNTWIGYASFLFEVIRLPVPDYLGMEKGWAPLPPQTQMMIENILPRPLAQKILTKCLNQSSDLITFFATRILVLAYQKLSTVQSRLLSGAESSSGEASLWRQASERLTNRFMERCPRMKDIINSFRQTPDDDDHALQREAVTRLMELCYRVTPLQAMEEQFDISAALTSRLVQSERPEQESSGVAEIRKLELEHLLQISRHSTGMKWFNKQGSLEFSPVVTLLKLHSKDTVNRTLRELLNYVLSENNVLSGASACDALVAASSETGALSAVVGQFLEDCFMRATRKPVKYLDDLEALMNVDYTTADAVSSKKAMLPSILVAVLLEQAPFVATKSAEVRGELEKWVSNFLELLESTDEDSDVLRKINTQVGTSTERLGSTAETLLARVRLPETTSKKTPQQSQDADVKAGVSFEAPPTEPDNHPELLKWAQKDLELALEEGDIAALMHCLCSHHQAIRTQAVSQLHKLEQKLLQSTIEDKDPIYVLVGELIETYEQHCGTALPYLAGTFASRALLVQAQPIHPLYPKVNRYLNKGAEWRVGKMPSYWLSNTLLSQPEDDDSYWKEALWVLQWLVDGLRTVADLDILRKAGVFEKLMGSYSSPGARREGAVKERVLELVWRATFLEGGSRMLITRTGVLAWLNMVKGKDGKMEESVKARLLETCDREQVEEWAGTTLDHL